MAFLRAFVFDTQLVPSCAMLNVDVLEDIDADAKLSSIGAQKFFFSPFSFSSRTGSRWLFAFFAFAPW